MPCQKIFPKYSQSVLVSPHPDALQCFPIIESSSLTLQHLKTEKDSSTKRKYGWTTTHSWFAYMGGFGINTKQGCEDLPGEYIPGSPRLLLSHRAIRVIAELGWLPDISKEAIKDKSKADALAKVLVITQASWIILQCIMRFACKLPVTTLELNTLAHAICACLIYAMWWDKPLDISEPAILDGDWAPGLAATLVVCSDKYAYPVLTRAWWSTDIQPEIKFMEWISPSSLRKLQREFPDRTPHHQARMDYSVLLFDPRAPQQRTTLDLSAPGVSYTIEGIPAETENETGREAWTRKISIAQIRDVGVVWYGPKAHVIDLTHLLRWQLFRGFMHDFPEVASLLFLLRSNDLGWRGSRFVRASPADFDVFPTLQGMGEAAKYASFQKSSAICGIIHGSASDILVQHFVINSKVDGRSLVGRAISNSPSPSFGNEEWKADLMSMSVFWAAALVYSAIHAAAWNDHFPTLIEAMAWKVSCVYIAGYGCIAMGFVTMLFWGFHGDLFESIGMTRMAKWMGLIKLWHWISDILPTIAKNLLLWSLLLFIGVVPLVFYFLCRGFLVVEAFISLRSLPRAAFRTPDWTQYLAHL